MKQVKTHGHIVHGSITQVTHNFEGAKLGQVGLVAYKLFGMLMYCVDFKSGEGCTTYQALIDAMTLPYKGVGRKPEAPTRAQIKHAMVELEEVGLIVRDKAHSEDAKRLFFVIAKRSWKDLRDSISDRLTDRRSYAQNPDKHGAKSDSARSSRPTSRPRINGSSNHQLINQKEAKLSTGTDPAGSAAEGEKLGPPGGQTHGPDGPRPPPEALTGSRQGVRKGQQVGPPGGRSDAPAGHAPRPAPDPADPATWERDAKGALIPPMRVERPKARANAPSPAWRKVALS